MLNLSGHLIFFVFGFARSGKDTFAKALTEAAPHAFGSVRVTHFAESLKNALANAMAVSDVSPPTIKAALNGDGPEKAIFRPAMVAYGEALRALTGPGVFAAQVVETIRGEVYGGLKPTRHESGELVGRLAHFIIADARYLSEYEAMEAAFPGRVIPVYMERVGGEPANEVEGRTVRELHRALLGRNPPFHVRAEPGDVRGIRAQAAAILWKVAEAKREPKAAPFAPPAPADDDTAESSAARD